MRISRSEREDRIMKLTARLGQRMKLLPPPLPVEDIYHLSVMSKDDYAMLQEVEQRVPKIICAESSGMIETVLIPTGRWRDALRRLFITVYPYRISSEGDFMYCSGEYSGFFSYRMELSFGENITMPWPRRQGSTSFGATCRLPIPLSVREYEVLNSMGEGAPRGHYAFLKGNVPKKPECSFTVVGKEDFEQLVTLKTWLASIGIMGLENVMVFYYLTLLLRNCTTYKQLLYVVPEFKMMLNPELQVGKASSFKTTNKPSLNRFLHALHLMYQKTGYGPLVKKVLTQLCMTDEIISEDKDRGVEIYQPRVGSTNQTPIPSGERHTPQTVIELLRRRRV